jgi:hypothetical protein
MPIPAYSPIPGHFVMPISPPVAVTATASIRGCEMMLLLPLIIFHYTRGKAWSANGIERIR